MAWLEGREAFSEPFPLVKIAKMFSGMLKFGYPLYGYDFSLLLYRSGHST